jgi:hypothetical protein
MPPIPSVQPAGYRSGCRLYAENDTLTTIMSRDVGAYCTLLALVSLLFFLTTQEHQLPGSASAVHTTKSSHIFTENDYFTELERRLTRFRQRTGYVIKLVQAHGVAPQDMSVVATKQFNLLQKHDPESKGIIVVVVDRVGGGAAVTTSEPLRARFPKPEIEGKITAMLQRRAQTDTPEEIVHVILEHLNLWFYVLDPSNTSRFLVRYPTAEMILLVFAPVLGLLTGISSIAFTPVRYLRQWSRFWVCGVVGVCVAFVFAWIVRQPGGIYPGMFGYALGMGFIVSGMVGLLKKYWLYETFKGRQSGGWWNGPVHFRYG